MSASEFDADTAITEAAGGSFHTVVSPRWHVAGAANGGYVMAIASRALTHAFRRDDPLTLTAHYLSPTAAGPATVDVERLRSGRMVASGQASLRQDGDERARVLGVLGTLAGDDSRLAGPGDRPPDLPPVEDCLRVPNATPGGVEAPITDRFDLRLHPDTAGWQRGAPTGRAEIGGWIRLRDGREPDTALLPVVVDAFPPTIFDLGYVGWVPTLELTVHVRARPAPGWLRCWIRSRLVGAGLVEEDAAVWDARGVLVAMSRQLARLPRPADA